MTHYFITIEGIEGTGKSTAIDYLKHYLNEKNIDFIATREPGGTKIAEEIRAIFLHSQAEKMYTDTELLLAFASRAQHIAHIIKPALSNGKWVLCDRFTDASYAYQGGGRGIDSQRIAVLENFVQGDLQPDLTLLLDAPVDIALARIDDRNKDRIEQEKIDFFHRVRQTYLDRAQQYPKRYRVIDATKTIAQVETQLKSHLDSLI